MKVNARLRYPVSCEHVFAMLVDRSFQERVCEATKALRYEVQIEQDAGSATITTRRELPTAALNDLLKRNFPDSRMAGSMLVASPSQDSLVMINVIPLCSATPELLAGIAMAQAHAALDLSNEIVASRRRESSDADADDEGDFDLDLFDEGEDDGEV